MDYIGFFFISILLFEEMKKNLKIKFHNQLR
jgi:hypothetical protein